VHLEKQLVIKSLELQKLYHIFARVIKNPVKFSPGQAMVTNLPEEDE